jgi:hypothetical protein
MSADLMFAVNLMGEREFTYCASRCATFENFVDMYISAEEGAAIFY